MDIDTGIDKKTNQPKVGLQSLANLETEYGKLPDTLRVKTGSGGTHYYFKTTLDIYNSTSKVALNIDVRGIGGYVILPPSNHESGGKYQWINEGTEIADLPGWLAKKMLDGKTEKTAPPVAEPSDKVPKKLTVSQATTLLNFIPPDCDRDTWWKVGVALKQALGDGAGLKLWNEWSRKAPDLFDAAEVQKQWESFDISKGITAGTLYHLAEGHGFPGFNELQETQLKANVAGNKELGWVYCISTEEFISPDVKHRLSKRQFSDKYAPQAPKMMKFADLCLVDAEYPRVDQLTFAPNQPLVLEEDGRLKMNLWQKPLVEPVGGEVAPFLKHAEFIIPNKNERKTYLQYLAFNMQRPGDKVRWAPLLQGKQRVGKSYFGRVMDWILGSGVRRPTNERLHETWTDWQEGAQLIVIEELMGLGRQQLLNKLKPMITEPTTMVRLPGGHAYEMPNRYNFLMFTNHKGALKIDEDDKRYFIVFSPAERKPDKYYDDLFLWTEANLSAIYWHLLREVDLSDFRPNSNAPETDARGEAIEANNSDLHNWIRDGIRDRSGLFACDLVVTTHLMENVPEFINRREVSTNAIAASLDRLGGKALVKRLLTSSGYRRAFSIRNHSQWDRATESKLGEHYESFLKFGSFAEVDPGLVDELSKGARRKVASDRHLDNMAKEMKPM